MFSIGEFSTITGLTVHTLRFYHELGLLVPAAVDPTTNYCSYDERNLETAKMIAELRGLGFPLEQIREALVDCREGKDSLGRLERQQKVLSDKVAYYQKALDAINRAIARERRTRDELNTATETIQERDIEPILVAGIKMRGQYSDCGQGFARLAKTLGRQIAGKPLCLFYDGEYRDGDASFEPCMPINRLISASGVTVHELPAVRCATLVHRGPYEEMKHSYARLLKYVNERHYKVGLPSREVYLKGPGMIFRGNPSNYVTEIQIPIERK